MQGRGEARSVPLPAEDPGSAAAACPALRIGLAGAGRWGANYVRTLLRLSGCQLVGIADPLVAVAPADTPTPGEHPRVLPDESRSPGSIPVFPDLESMLASVAPEAVIIAAPDPVHHPLARTCLEAGCDVIVEKPMALSYVEACDLDSLARSRGLVLAVGQTTLYLPGYRQLRADLDRGLIGRPFAARSIRTSGGIPGSDLLWDLAPHTVALAVGLFGLPDRVVAPGNSSGLHEARAARFRLSYPGLELDATIAWTPGPVERRLTVDGSDGSLEFDELLPVESPPLTQLCRDFILCCRTRRTPLADARTGARVVRVIEALKDSTRADGRPVTLDSALACR